MSDMPAYLADAWLTFLAGIACLIVLRSLDLLQPSGPLRSRFRFMLSLLMTLMFARVGHWAGAGWAFSALTHACAALMPLAALLLAEGFLRRHAPPALKALTAGGGALMCLVGLMQFQAFEPLRIGGLLALLLAGLIGVALFVQRRDRDSLAASENALIARMSLGFALILPLLATDFMRDDAGDIPVRMGALGVLALCWLSISLGRPGLSSQKVVLGFAVITTMAVGLTLLVQGIAPQSPRALVQIGVSILGAIVLLAVMQAAIALQIEDQQNIALGEIARADATGPEAALGFVRRAAGAPDAVLLTPGDLSGLSETELTQSLASNPVQSVETASESAAWLMERFGASHLMLVGRAPLNLIVLDRPSLDLTDGTGEGLRALQRVAQGMTRDD
ncbi:MAG: hypothetical protein AAFN09_06075 [Pseudomonadota bacterium]